MTELNPKSKVTFLIWTQRIAEHKFSLSDSVIRSAKVNLNNSVFVRFGQLGKYSIPYGLTFAERKLTSVFR